LVLGEKSKRGATEVSSPPGSEETDVLGKYSYWRDDFPIGKQKIFLRGGRRSGKLWRKNPVELKTRKPGGGNSAPPPKREEERPRGTCEA